ncbi:MAG: nucleotidyl transferase AbiEii/AbiGii toxin family protein [Cyclobacteriaceae bacterium]
MLHFAAVETSTLGLLKKLMSIDEFDGLRLVGGTALALQFGHRKSIDLDLFGKQTHETIELTNILNKVGDVQVIKDSPAIKIYSLNGIKVDFVNYPYAWSNDIISEEKLRLAHPEDIGAMKLAAITGRGSKKNFVDLYFLLKKYSLKELISFYQNKYHDGSVFLALKSLTYFEDADQDEDLNMLIETQWAQIKETILRVHGEYMSNLT